MNMKYTPYEKCSKREKRRRSNERRRGWGTLSPVTRRGKGTAEYKMKKARKDDDNPFAL